MRVASGDDFGLEFSLNYIDYELYPPTDLDQRRNAFDEADAYHQHVPLIRLFGRTDAGQHICALVHGVYPYMYVEFDGPLDPDSVNSHCLRLHRNINVVLSTTYRRNPHEDSSTFVADVSVCKATPFYGLHSGWRYYYKVSLLSPKHMTRLADLFRSGSILGRALQPYESHVPYLLQFMIDYNLYGCGSIRSQSVVFRAPLPAAKVSSIETSSEGYSHGSVHSLHGHMQLSVANIPEHKVLDMTYQRCSHSEIEIDIAAGSLLNRSALKARAIHYDIETERDNFVDNNERVLPSLTELWKDDTRRREAMGLASSRSQAPQSNVRVRSNVWNNEADLKQSLELILQRQATRGEGKDGLNPIEHPRKASEDLDIPTSFESIQQFCDRLSLVATYKPLSKAQENQPIQPLESNKQSAGLAQVMAFEKQRSEFAMTQLLKSKTQSQTLTSQVGDSLGSFPVKFCSHSNADLEKHISLSKISNYLTRPLRLRGGSGLHESERLQHAVLQFQQNPPLRSHLDAQRLDFVASEFPEPYYSDAADVPQLAKDYAINGMMPKSRDVIHLPPFFAESGTHNSGSRHQSGRMFQYHKIPPTRAQLANSWSTSRFPATKQSRSTQILLPTQMQKTASGQPAKRISESDVPLSVISIEVHAQSQGTMLPNPATDPVIAIFWSFQDFGMLTPMREGCLFSTQAVDQWEGLKKFRSHQLEIFDSEIELVHALVDLVQELDPDAVLSFEMQNSSIGFIEERVKTSFGFSVCAELGRIVAPAKDEPGYNDRWGETHATSVKISGRHVLNLWRIMRSEMNLLQYTLENVCYHQLKLRIPKYTHADLHRWLTSGRSGPQQRVYTYYAQRTRLNLEIIESQGLLSRVSEQARILGIDFYSVFSRGSQFKVESLMFRIAKPECFMMMSPSKKQVAQQNALECLPLVMEPQSRFYHDPVVVLDFQSLYPSIMIAYNFCYSTCLGKLGYNGLESKLGVSQYAPEAQVMQQLSEDIEIAPNGVLYVRESRRKSLLAKMLHDLLETRAMVKEGMKLCKNDKAAQKLMHNRQLALKLIANVTYGYTSASFSGRMPCADIADSIVQTGRETLEKAIEFIHGHESWNAEVVYGDTDSLFVKLPGRTKQQAFELGAQMASAITNMSPSPIKLKFEKVYLPCVLLAKKRYVGFKYESPSDVEPVFDAKGIETVRRDGTPAEQKIEERALKILFRTGDLSGVKEYFQQECWKIMTGRCSLHDFCFAKEVKLGSYSTKGVPPPGAVISAKSIAADPRSEPQYGERVSYLVISGASRSRLTDRCVPPEELLLNPDLRLDVEYYITKNLIPPLDRIFSLMGVNVRSWYDEMPRSSKLQINRPQTLTKSTTTTTTRIGLNKSMNVIETFLTSSHCPICHREVSAKSGGPCEFCKATPDTSIYALASTSRVSELTHASILGICASCCRIPRGVEVACMSKDCPVYYKRVKSGREVNVDLVRGLQDELTGRS